MQTTWSNLCAVNREVIVLELISEDERIIYQLGVTVRFIIITHLFIISLLIDFFVIGHQKIIFLSKVTRLVQSVKIIH